MQAHVENKAVVKASLTAYTMATAFTRGRAYKYEKLFSDIEELNCAQHLAEIGLSSIEGGAWFILKFLSYCPYYFQQVFFNLTCTASYDEITVLRKLMIKNKIHEEIENGCSQIVFLGGGYDVRPWATAKNYPNVHIFEMDRAPTRNFKLAGLRSLPKSIVEHCKSDEVSIFNDNLHLIHFDVIEDDLFLKLKNNGFNLGKKTLFIAEGLTAYIDEEQNKKLLTQLSKIMGKSELLISFMSSAITYRVVESAVKNTNELHFFSLPKHETIPFANGCKLQVVEQFDVTQHLANLGNKEDQTYYDNNSSVPRECYYLMKPLETDLQKINEIKEIDTYQLKF